MTKKPNLVTFTEYEQNHLVVVRFDTGRNASYYPYGPIVILYHVGDGDSTHEFSWRYMRHENDNTADWKTREQVLRDLPEEIVAEAEKRVRRLHKDYDAHVAKGRKSWQYKMLEKFSKQVDVSPTYLDDLRVFDAYHLWEHNPEQWVGCIYASGTRLWCPACGESQAQRADDTRYSSKAHYYHATRSGLKEITADEYAKFVFK